MMNQYKNSTSSKKKTDKDDKKFDLKNYFNTFLEKGVNSADRRIRILPSSDENKSAFVEIHGHKQQVEGEWKTFVCPKHERGENCPFCEARELLLATGDAEDKKEANKFSAKKMYVVKIIDREDPDHGVKFWRFNHDYRNTGTLDKIMGVLKTVGQDITDVKTGRDLNISINRDAKDRPVISSINQTDQVALSEDENQVAEWLADDRTWNDVYGVKPYDYLELIVRGAVPAWKKDDSERGGKYVDKTSLNTKTDSNEGQKEELDTELSMGVDKANAELEANAQNQSPITKESAISESSDDEDDDDLPF
jgi:hypothetical protein